MFYSQFILAKKGPLGTIWIAAHLERKLRKNQVADTDIGVSVDSILFPEVPIALRLSSHLLLGVVRIYSRKVNYLFHDCSEALLKVKQAFRSTAVDLPPEESTAPYHSITLPETFDLDDFELPDSYIFQGNYVDHHISTREQITLQDTMDGVVYSTSKFGLDERFGDGDASQIGLDLDEELFLDKVNTPGLTAELLDPDDFSVDPQEAAQPITPFSIMDIDEHQIKSVDDKMAEDLEVMPADNEEHIHSNSQYQEIASPLDCGMYSPDLNEKGFPSEQFGAHPSTERAQATSTSKLAEGVVLSNGHFEGIPTLSPMKETSPCNSAELIRRGDTCNLQLESESYDSTKLVHDENPGNCDTNGAGYSSLLNDKSSEIHVLHMPHEESIQVKEVKRRVDSPSATVPVDAISLGANGSVRSPTSVLSETPKLISPASECLDRSLAASDIGERVGTSLNGVITDNIPSGSVVHQTDSGGLTPQGTSVDCAVASNSAEACSKPSPSAESACLVFDSTNNCDPVSKGWPESVLSTEISEPQASVIVGPVGDLQESFSPKHALCSSVDSLLGPVGEHDVEKIEAKACPEPEDKDINSHVGLDGKLSLDNPDNHMLRVCNSLQKESDVLAMEAEASPLQILGRENQVDASETSALLRGEDCHLTSDRDMISEASQMVESCPSGVQADLSKLDEPHNIDSSKDDQSDNLNHPSNCDLPAPEMLLSAPATVLDVPSNLLSSEKEVSSEHEGSGSGSKILSGKKRQSMENSPILQDENSAKLSGVSRSKRTMDSVPDDDDLLSSILVGRRSSSLKMRPTPPPPELTSSKRPRLNPRNNVPKRKVLLDDTMVLHGDTIRQQLTTTEDIRRTRRKAPCTRPEIWMIQRHLLEDEVLCEPVFTGISADLIGLHNRTYDLIDVRDCDMDVENTLPKEQNKTELSVDHIGGTSFDGKPEPPAVSGNNGKGHEPAETLMVTENHLSQDLSIGSGRCDTQGKMGLLDKFPDDLPRGDQLVEMSTMETEKQDNENADIAEHAATLGELSAGAKDFVMDKANYKGGDACEVAEMNEKDLILGKREQDGSVNQETEIDGSDHVVLQNSSQDCQFDLGKTSSCLGTATTLENTSVENSVEVPKDIATPLDHVNTPFTEVCVGDDGPTSLPFVTGKLSHEETRSEFVDMIEDKVLDNTLMDGEGHFCPRFMSIEEPQRDSSCSLELHVGTEIVPRGVYDETNNGSTLEEENAALNNASVKESDDFGNMVDGNDTEFLNFDDDDVLEEEEDNSMPTAEETRLLDNSGWSSRTRAVARFLQTLFDKESGDERKVLPMDNLLSGKTRKEASRMFFETLVLKTRDYIHVEQENPFNNINIKPKVKLMKSDF